MALPQEIDKLINYEYWVGLWLKTFRCHSSLFVVMRLIGRRGLLSPTEAHVVVPGGEVVHLLSRRFTITVRPLLPRIIPDPRIIESI